MRLLLVEDDRMIGGDLSHALGRDGHAVDWVVDGQAAELALQSTQFDLALLRLEHPFQRCLEVVGNLVDDVVAADLDAQAVGQHAGLLVRHDAGED